MIPFLDLAADLAEVEADARRRIDGVLARTQFVLGPETAEFEDALRRRLGAASAVAVSSGSDALSLALLALGIGPGDAVVLPSFTFFATAGAVVRAGAVPVFCDIDPATFLAGAAEMRACIDREFENPGAGPDSTKSGSVSTLRHRTTGARLAALLPVHLYGRACDMDGILGLARQTGARVIEDAAQAIDSRCGDVPVGCAGDVGCFSFYPTKNLGGAGDGGLVTCRDAELGARIARLRSHGSDPDSYEHHEVGINARMPELVAAVLNAKLARLTAWTARRRELAALYTAQLGDAARAGLLELPSPCTPASHVWHQYVVRIAARRGGTHSAARDTTGEGGGDAADVRADGGAGRSRRDRVKAALEERGIATRVFYPMPLHLQPCFGPPDGRREGRPRLPHAETAAAEVLCLPMYPSLGDAAAVQVAEALAAAVKA